MMIAMLAVVLFVLMLAIGGRRGLSSFVSLLVNFMVLALIISMIARGTNAIWATVAGCLIITTLTLLLNVGINLKSLSSWLSVLLVLLFNGLYSGFLVTSTGIGGFSQPEYPSIAMFNHSIGINMADVAVAVILFKLVGAMIDTSVAISSFSSEAVRVSPGQSEAHLFQSAMNVGRDILGTTINTLYFAFLGSFMTLFVWFILHGYTFAMVINSKVLTRELIRILSSGLGCVLIIPVTAAVSTFLFLREQRQEIGP